LEPVNLEFSEAYATIYFISRLQTRDENGKDHEYYQTIGLAYKAGLLKNIIYIVTDKYQTSEYEKIENNIIGIWFNNPAYIGNDVKSNLEALYYKDQKFNVIYSIKTDFQQEIKVRHCGMFSPDNIALYEDVTHAVQNQVNFTYCIY